MSIDSKEVKVFTLTPEETEKLLNDKFGAKLAPVDDAKLAKQRQKRENQRARFSSGQ